MYECTVISLKANANVHIVAYIMADGTVAIHDQRRKRNTLLMQADWNSHDLGFVGAVVARSLARTAIVWRDMVTNEADEYDTDLLAESIREGLYMLVHDGLRTNDRCRDVAKALRDSDGGSICVERMTDRARIVTGVAK